MLIVVLIVLAVVLVGALTGALVWFAGQRPTAMGAQTLSEPTTSYAHVPLGEGPVGADAVDALTFDQTVRGYRMSQVDAVLDRLRDELARRDEELSRLQVDLDVARSAHTGDPELGHGPVVRPSGSSSLWAPGTVRSFQAGDDTDVPQADGDPRPLDDGR